MTVTNIRPDLSTPSRKLAGAVRMEAALQGISIREISRRLDVSQPWVSRRVSIRADVDMTFEDLEKIAEALGVSAERLIANSGWLPRLDSNQQPSGYWPNRVLGRIIPAPLPDPRDDEPTAVAA